MIPCSLQDVLFQPCTCCVTHRAETARRDQLEVEAAQCPTHAQPRALLCPLCLNNILTAARQTARETLLQEMLDKIPEGQGVPDAWLDILRPAGEAAPMLPLVPCEGEKCGEPHAP